MINKKYCQDCKLCKASKVVKEVDPKDSKKTIDVILPPDRSCASKEARNSRDFKLCKNFVDNKEK